MGRERILALIDDLIDQLKQCAMEHAEGRSWSYVHECIACIDELVAIRMRIEPKDLFGRPVQQPRTVPCEKR